MIISKTFWFEAAHNLPDYEGACANLHGHSYKLTVYIKGPISLETGMVMDYKDLKKLVEDTVINKYDHENLNKFFRNPTAELMVDAIGIALDIALFNTSLECIQVDLWETQNSCATWRKYEN